MAAPGPSPSDVQSRGRSIGPSRFRQTDGKYGRSPQPAYSSVRISDVVTDELDTGTARSISRQGSIKEMRKRTDVWFLPLRHAKHRETCLRSSGSAREEGVEPENRRQRRTVCCASAEPD
jgi:hypothetical protein